MNDKIHFHQKKNVFKPWCDRSKSIIGTVDVGKDRLFIVLKRNQSEVIHF